MNLPYATPEFPGIGGEIKQRPEDFFVQELPLYEAGGEGEHVFCEIQKIGLTTFQAVDRIAGALGVSPRDIGYAGMKDAHAVSRQLFSIWGTTPEKVMALQIPNITVQWAARHGNKLRLGHLAGNRFAVKIRGVNPTDLIKLSGAMKQLETRGLPNYFGDQRFGYRGNNDKLGAAIIRGDDRQLLGLLLGTPDSRLDDPQSMAARTAFDAGELDKALKLYPRRCGMERRLLSRLANTSRVAATVRAIEERLKRLWVSALQSSLFNQVVAQRVRALDQLMPGDLAEKHENGAVFLVHDAAVEQPRADRFAISPTGPLAGYRLTLPEHEPLKIEQAVLEANGLALGDFRVAGRLKVKGARRSLRVRPENVELSSGVDEHGAFIAAAFTLPSGSFATVLLRELMKTENPASEEPAADPQTAESPTADQADQEALPNGPT